MRIAVLSDVHSNLEALEAVLRACEEHRAGATYVLGDLVGYGADPNAVVDRLAGLPAAHLIAGNHDLAATDRFPLDWFNAAAAAAVRWTTERLTASARRLLEGLEPRERTGTALLVHGSPVEPATEYLMPWEEGGAARSFDHEEFALCFFGHTHVPTAFVRDRRGRIRAGALQDGAVVEAQPEGRLMVNPGSVGQPRDGDPRASFLMYDTEDRRAAVHRVAYPVEEAQEKIRSAGLPAALADRLAAGR